MALFRRGLALLFFAVVSAEDATELLQVSTMSEFQRLYAEAGVPFPSVHIYHNDVTGRKKHRDDAIQANTDAWNNWFKMILEEWKETDPEDARIYEEWAAEHQQNATDACMPETMPKKSRSKGVNKHREQQFQLCQAEWLMKHNTAPPVKIPISQLKKKVGTAYNLNQQMQFAQQQPPMYQAPAQPQYAPSMPQQPPMYQAPAQPQQTQFVQQQAPMYQAPAQPQQTQFVQQQAPMYQAPAQPQQQFAQPPAYKAPEFVSAQPVKAQSTEQAQYLQQQNHFFR